ncbi:MAG TPA: HigA family addiction module antitoxin [Thermoanaerobaculia bacterium]|nr:HigA family addiction module antitoxin [Thermoanaerobaculia bacterium]
MLPTKRIPTHPGVMLVEEFLNPMGLTQARFAAHIGVPLQRVNEIVRGRRGVTPDTALRLSDALGTTAEFWLNLQTSHDLALARSARRNQPKVLAVSRRRAAVAAKKK